jgi:hypothetical protein
MTYQKHEPEFWHNIKRGDIISLSDEETISESMEAGEGVNAVDFTIDANPETFIDQAGCECIMISLAATGKTDLMLYVIIFDGDVEVKAFFEDRESFEPSSRDVILEDGQEWIFEEPEDMDDFDVADLEFARIINFDDTTYKMKATGTAHGQFRHDSELLAFVTEYDLTEAEDEECTSTELLIVEKFRPDSQGFVSLYFGYKINFMDITVLQA